MWRTKFTAPLLMASTLRLLALELFGKKDVDVRYDDAEWIKPVKGMLDPIRDARSKLIQFKKFLTGFTGLL